MKSLGIPFKQRPLFFSSHSHMKRWRPLHQELLYVVPKSTSPVPPCDKLQQSKTTPQLCLNFCAEGGGRYLLNTNHQQSYRPAFFGKFSGMNGLMTIKHYYIYLGLNILVNHIFFLLLTLPNFLFFWQTRKDQELTYFWPWCYYSFNTITALSLAAPNLSATYNYLVLPGILFPNENRSCHQQRPLYSCVYSWHAGKVLWVQLCRHAGPAAMAVFVPLSWNSTVLVSSRSRSAAWETGFAGCLREGKGLIFLQTF